MGIVRHQASKRRITLATRSLIGRAGHCEVRLSSRRSSGEHAVLFWTGERWSLRDLGSTNGSQLGERTLQRGERVLLDTGAEMTFGDEAERWLLEDAGPPTACAYACEDGAVRMAENGLLALPSEDLPLLTMAQDEFGQWWLESNDESRPAVDQEVVEAGGTWRLHLPPLSSDSGVAAASLDSIDSMLLGTTLLRFEMSQDQEFVTLALVHTEAEISLGARVHHEPLMLLARERLRDASTGVPIAEQGWMYVEDLLRELQIDLHHFNVQMYRARKQLAAAGVINVAALIERRSTTRQVRFGTSVATIRSS